MNDEVFGVLRAILRNQGILAGMIQTLGLHTLRGENATVIRALNFLERSAVAIQKEILEQHPKPKESTDGETQPNAGAA